MLTPEQLASYRDLSARDGYADVRSLLAHIDAQAARIAELEAKLLVEREAYLRERARCEQLEARDELTCDDIERLRLALRWEGYSTPEGLENCAARWPSLVRDLIAGVLVRKSRAQAVNQQLTTESPATGKDCLHVQPAGWIDPNDKTQKQYLPNIGEPVLFCHRGVTYYGKHTGGSFQSGMGFAAKNFNTWQCRWMYPPAAAATKPEGQP